MPLPTYFIGSFGQGAARAIESLSDADASVRYLGRSGIKQLHGLNVAYLDGIYDKQAFQDGSTTASCRHYTKVGWGLDRFIHQSCCSADKLCAGGHLDAVRACSDGRHVQEDVRALERAVDRAEGDVDILLTCEWPADVTAAVPPGSAPADVGSTGGHCLSGTRHAAASLATHVVGLCLGDTCVHMHACAVCVVGMPT